ncbi:hypothetical protein P879_03462 [Paragonimus westermani]|uniref:Non-lysosomal glucosylceramidase n=1 Tax=Paragonimus westermani TaxID=34504 RepID=A0A8T0DMZ0_9TREM|nr:hypothetical protein P879_03462 [Paragonimus westermani]
MAIHQDQNIIEYLEKSGLISKYGWKARFDHQPEVQCKPFGLPRLSQIKSFIPMSFRYTFKFYLRKRLVERRLPFLDPTQHVPWRPIYGVPMGGIGCGAIGRGYRGEFVRSSLIPGMYAYDKQPTDQFILTVRNQNKVLHQQVLSPHNNPSSVPSGLRSWSWGFPVENAHYVGLYPRSWTIYELPQFKLVLICQQISPVIPHNYKTTCLPSCVFVWRLLNLGAVPLNVSISFSWYGPDHIPRNNTNSSSSSVSQPSSTRQQSDPASECVDHIVVSEESLQSANGTASECLSSYHCHSCSFSSDLSNTYGCLSDRMIGNELPCCFGIAAKNTDQVTVSRCPGFLFERHLSLNLGVPAFVNTGVSDSLSAADMRSYQSAPSARMVWNELQSPSGLKDTGTANYFIPNTPSVRRRNPKLAMIVSAACTVPAAHPNAGNSSAPGQAQIEFAVVWHSPVVRFRGNGVVYTRRYARWFPQPGMEGAKRLLEHALTNWPRWVSKIEQWQSPILENRQVIITRFHSHNDAFVSSSLPDWYKSALFNELYYLTDGGTLWLDPVQVGAVHSDGTDIIPIDFVRIDKGKSKIDPHELTGRAGAKSKSAVDWKWECWRSRAQLAREIGLFAYLEGHEYRMFNTVDVHYYSSWALIKLWPKLQLAFNYDCADLTIEEDQTETYFIHRGLYGIRNVESSVPHDFGDPENEPWRDVNAYVMFPTDNWKDLNPKFILQAWRDWRLTQDDHYLLYMLPIIYRVIRICLKAWDLDGDGIIENSGFPDQTFDTWTACGISAYTGGVWIACLYAAHDMLEYALSANSPFGAWLHQSHDETGTPWTQVKKELLSVLTGAKLAYNRALWTGSYYAYQNTRSGNHNSIMAAQLCGHWFLRATGAPADAILPSSQVLIALKTIQDVNWQSIKKGVAGAVNGALPGSKQDLSNVQAEEFWVGINYAIASTMIMEGMTEEGLSLAGACYNTVYNRFGLQFQTPEAYLLDGRFRCPGYMRPLAIWSIQQALELTNQHHTSAVISNPVTDEDDDDHLPNPSQRR